MSISPEAPSAEVVQREFSAHLRHPDINSPPDGIEDRRLQIYRDLVYNNIEGFISNGFPVLRKIYTDQHWHSMVRDFVYRHQSQSPYFLDLGREFITYLENERAVCESDPPFLFELATYEFAELALFVADQKLPISNREVDPDFMDAVPVLSPLAWSMVFQFPVHKIGVDYQPVEPEGTPVCLVVYRNRKDKVKFLESNPMTARLLELCENNESRTAKELLEQIGLELQSEKIDAILDGGLAILAQLRNLDIIFF